MTPRRRHNTGGSSSHHDTDTPDPTRRPSGGTDGDGVDVDTDGIDSMAGRLDNTGGRVDAVGTTVGDINVGPQSMGVVGSGFTGATQTHLQSARQQVVRTRQAVQNAQAGTSATARNYRDTDTTNAQNLGGIDTSTDVPTARGGSTTTPSGATGPTDTTNPQGTPGGNQSIGDRLGGDDDGPPPPDRRRSPGDDGGDRQPDRNQPPPRRDGQSLGRFDESRLQRDGNGRITHIDGMPAEQKLRDIARERTQQYMNEKNGVNADGTPLPGGRNADLSGGQTGNIVAHVMDTRTGEIFETTNGPKGSEIPPSRVHPEIQRRVDEINAAGPYPEFDKNGNPTGNTQPYPGFDVPLRHAEVRGVNEALHANPGASIDDMIADTTFMRASGLKDAPFCANCSGILAGVPSNSGRLEFDHSTGRIHERPR
jgi:hypothetical protein